MVNPIEEKICKTCGKQLTSNALETWKKELLSYVEPNKIYRAKDLLVFIVEEEFSLKTTGGGI